MLHVSQQCYILCCLEYYEDFLSSSQIAWWMQGRLFWMDLMVKSWPSWLASGWHLGEAQGCLKMPFAITGTFGSSQGTCEYLASHNHPRNPRESCYSLHSGSVQTQILDPSFYSWIPLPSPVVCFLPQPFTLALLAPHLLLVRRGKISLLDR